ncbi:TPA: hypothetical protein ACJ2XA_004521 [Kluyvera georgiana]
MTGSKRGRVPTTIKEAVQEQFSCMGESYSANIKWGKSVNAHYFKVIRELDQPEPTFYTFSVIDEEIHYTYFDVNTFEATQLSFSFSEDAFFQFMFRCDLPLDFDAFTEIMRLISLNGLDVTAFYK